VLFTTYNGVGGFGSVIHGFGAPRTFIKGTDFNCNQYICYGIGPNHQLFKDLQTTLNRYGQTFGSFKPLLVDGFIGDSTVKAVAIAAATANIASLGMTREAVAANAPALIEQLTAFLVPVVPTQPIQPPIVVTQQQPQPAQPARPQPVQPGQLSPQPAPPPAQPTPVTHPGAQTTPSPGAQTPPAASLVPLTPTASKIPTWVWITAGVTGAVVVGLVGFALRKPAPEALGRDDDYDYDDYGYGSRYRRRWW